MIDGQTELVGLIGWPVEHSLSPAMHNSAFQALGMNWRYLPLPVPPGQVEAAVRGLAALGFRGANVTVPHKQAALAGLADLGPAAARLGAVNTLVVEREPGGEASTSGYNTDSSGFVTALEAAGIELGEGQRAVVLGAGGAARAVVFGLLRSGIGEVTLLNRTLERVDALARDLAGAGTGQIRTLPLNPESLVEAARATDLLVNATTVGMWPDVEVSPWPRVAPIPPHLAVFDLVYNPLETRLLRQARRAGARPIDGLEMLVQQGAQAFCLWTGRDSAPQVAALMRSACERVLRR